MADIYRLAEAKAHVHEVVRGGRCEDDPAVTTAINNAISTLLEQGDWKGTVMPIKLAVYNGMAHLPRGFEAALSVNICGKVSDVWHNSYEFMEPGPGDMDCYTSTACDDVIGLMDKGEHATFWPLYKPLKICAASEYDEDVGLQLKVWGTCGPYRENVLMSAGASGSGENITVFKWENAIPGEILKSDLDANVGTAKFVSIDTIEKPETRGYITLFGYDTDTHDIQYLAKIHPKELTPRYRWYQIPGVPMNQGIEVKMLVKRGFVKAMYDDDVLLIQNLEAIREEIMAQDEKRRGSFQLGMAHSAEAIRLLRNQLKNYKRGQKILNVRMEGGYVIGDDLTVL